MHFAVLHPKFDVFTPRFKLFTPSLTPTKKARLDGWASRVKEVGLLFQSNFFLVPIERVLHRILIDTQLLADSTIANYFPVFIKSTA